MNTSINGRVVREVTWRNRFLGKRYGSRASSQD